MSNQFSANFQPYIVHEYTFDDLRIANHCWRKTRYVKFNGNHYLLVSVDSRRSNAFTVRTTIKLRLLDDYFSWYHEDIVFFDLSSLFPVINAIPADTITG